MMKHPTHDHDEVSLPAQSRPNADARLVDLSNLPKPRWRDALIALAAPATRVHQYRNLHRSMFYESVCQIDCKDKQ